MCKLIIVPTISSQYQWIRIFFNPMKDQNIQIKIKMCQCFKKIRKIMI
jgi:hypothetical protein